MKRESNQLSLQKSDGKVDFFDRLICRASDLKLDKFIICLCDEKYDSLILSKCTKEEVKQAWDKIYDEYISIVKDKQMSYLMILHKEIALLELKINCVNICVSILSIKKDEEIINTIRKFVPVYGKLDIENLEQYEKDLNAIVNYTKQFIIEKDAKILEFDELNKGGSGKINRDYFDKLIVQISKYVKYHISKYDISVSEFANLQADYNAYCDYQIKQANGR